MIKHSPLSQILDPVQGGMVLGDVLSRGIAQPEWENALACDNSQGNGNCRPFGKDQITDFGEAL